MLNGSPRKNGNIALAFGEMAQVFEKNGVEYENILLGRMDIRGCIACETCRKNHKCAFDDVVNELAGKFEKADGLVIGSPVYYGQPNGTVLSLLQRMFYSAGKYFEGKPAAAVAVCRRGGATAAFQTLQMPFQMMNMPIVTSQYWNIVYGREEGQAALDAEGMQTMRTLARNMAYLLKATEGKKRPEAEPRQATHFIR